MAGCGGIGGNPNVGGSTSFGTPTESTSAGTGGVLLAGGLGAAKRVSSGALASDDYLQSRNGYRLRLTNGTDVYELGLLNDISALDISLMNSTTGSTRARLNIGSMPAGNAAPTPYTSTLMLYRACSNIYATQSRLLVEASPGQYRITSI
jgi:hypothetical protein